jgi:hypothetical protein
VNCRAAADQEPEVRGAIAEVHHEVADLLGGLRPVRVRGDPWDVDVARADFDDEQAIQALERYRAVQVDEVGGEHGRCSGVQELPPRRVSAPFGAGGRCRALRCFSKADGATAGWLPGVTSRCASSLLGRCRISVARTARSPQPSLGFGLRRRNAATSCRRTSSSAFLDTDERPSRTSQPLRRTKIR